MMAGAGQGGDEQRPAVWGDGAVAADEVVALTASLAWSTTLPALPPSGNRGERPWALELARDASTQAVKRVFEEVLAGFSVLPVEVVQALVAQHHRTVEEPPPEREIAWLRELAAGATVAQLAERSGYSERAMFRLLRALYQRLGVRRRTEALMLAHQRGWL